MNINIHVYSGQALLTLLLFTIISVTIATAAIIILFVNARSTTSFAQYHELKTVADSGIENALLRLLRNPEYTGETLLIDGITDNVSVVPRGSQYTIISNASYRNYLSTVVAIASSSADAINIVSWKGQ